MQSLYEEQRYKNQLIHLQITSWKQLQNGLFDYRTEKYQQKYLFFSSKYTLTPPSTNKYVYYIIHQPTSNDIKNMHKQFRLERRKKKVSLWDGRGKIEDYKLMGAFKITKNRKNQVSIQAIAAKDIVNGNLYKKEKVSTILPFWVVRTLPRWVLKKGQIVKFGRLQLLVSEVSVDLNKNEDKNKELILDIQQKIEDSLLQSNIGQQKRCKVCYGTQAQDPLNKLITPCNCKGSIKYVHVDCLKEWLMNKMTKVSLEQNGKLKINDKECCQVCKAKYPLKIKVNGQTIPIMDYISEYQYVAFQSVNHQNQLRLQGQIYLSFEGEKSVKIGRLQESNGLLLGDQTVSRNHSILQIQGNQCILKDLQSKYGTLVYDQEVEIKIGNRLKAFQIQSSVFCFKYH